MRFREHARSLAPSVPRLLCIAYANFWRRERRNHRSSIQRKLICRRRSLSGIPGLLDMIDRIVVSKMPLRIHQVSEKTEVIRVFERMQCRCRGFPSRCQNPSHLHVEACVGLGTEPHFFCLATLKPTPNQPTPAPADKVFKIADVHDCQLRRSIPPHLSRHSWRLLHRPSPIT